MALGAFRAKLDRPATDYEAARELFEFLEQLEAVCDDEVCRKVCTANFISISHSAWMTHPPSDISNTSFMCIHVYYHAWMADRARRRCSSSWRRSAARPRTDAGYLYEHPAAQHGSQPAAPYGRPSCQLIEKEAMVHKVALSSSA
ncbi:hypothetical protein PLESTM_000731500 [Pleodorina starrii]|nr:hypothetical protein PLESTM_000731500 [Pleodorina starrii]